MSKRTEHIAQLRKQAAFHRAQAGFSYQRIYALEDENKALRGQVAAMRGVVPEVPPRPPEGCGLPRYGIRFNGPSQPLSVPMDDGYWTPWHLAEALRARVVMFTDFGNDVIIETFRRNGFLIELGASYSVKGQIAQLLNALEELARLNGKAVSEGLLHETIRSVDDIFWAIHAKPSCQSGVVARCRCSLCAGTRLAMARDDLSALLGEGKEHE